MSQLFARLREPLRVLAALGTAGFAVLTLLRFIEIEIESAMLLAVVALAPWVMAMGMLLVAVLTGWKVGVAALAAIVVFAMAALPGTVIPRMGCDVVAGRSDSDVVVFSHNVLFGVPGTDVIAEQIASVEPDIVVLQEADELIAGELLDRFDGLAHGVTEGRQVILSRWEISEVEQTLPFGNGTHALLRSEIDTPLGVVDVVNVHATPPIIDGGRQSQFAQFDYLAGTDFSNPVLAMGDFNAAPSDKRFRASVGSSDFIDARREAGCGFGVSWSATPGSGPAHLAIDHALVAGLTVESFEVLDYVGSDHKAIAVRLSS